MNNVRYELPVGFLCSSDEMETINRHRLYFEELYNMKIKDISIYKVRGCTTKLRIEFIKEIKMDRVNGSFEKLRLDMGAKLEIDDLCTVASKADVYIAGPLDNVAERYQNAFVAHAIREVSNLRVFVPQELNETYSKFNKPLDYDVTYPVDMAAINNCKIAIIEVTRQDPGTIAELGYLIGRKKHDNPELQIIVLQSNPFEELNFYVNGMIHDDSVTKLITVPSKLNGNPSNELTYIGKTIQGFVKEFVKFNNHF